MQSSPLSNLVENNKDLITVTGEDTITKVLEILQDNDIISVPIIDNNNKIAAIVSVKDLLTYIAYGTFKFTVDVPAVMNTDTLDIQMKDMVDQLNSCPFTKVMIYDGDSSLNSVLEPFSKGFHRVLVRLGADEDERTLKYLSQTDILKFIGSHMNQHKLTAKTPVVTQTAEQLGLWNPSDNEKVISITDKCTALSGLRKMNMYDLVAIPVVHHKTGVLITQLSASDLRGMSAKSISILQLNIIDFLNRRYNNQLKAPVTTFPSASLEQIIYTFCYTGIHRIWITSFNGNPIGCISLSDVISKFSPFDYKLVDESSYYYNLEE